MANFKTFALALAAHFAEMSKSELFRVDISGDDMWAAYLAAFPAGSNPIYRVRTEHDGSYDRAFVRKVGNVVRINDDGTLTSIWDIPDLEFPYSKVAWDLAEMVKAASLNTLFRIGETKIGVVSNVENKDGVTTQFHHFHADIHRKHLLSGAEIDTFLGNANTTMMVMRRGFTEITTDAIDTVLDLINTGNLYRGQEFKAGVEQFRKLQMQFLDAPNDQARDIVAWNNYTSPAARLRNTVIGTLLTDLSDGKDLEYAVKAYEQKVAPTNYKRPSALITPSMIKQATDTIAQLGLESALERRFATISDVSINDVLWADNSVQPLMKNSLSDLLMKEAKPAKVNADRAIEIGIADFMEKVLPKAVSMELFFSNQHQANLMSITAPVHADAGQLFKWSNGFAWSYAGNITDSIKEKVKAAGGNTNAVLRVSLAWHNFDDLDLHCKCPDGHVYFAAKSGTRYGNNILDVDMNAGGGKTRQPVENLSWTNPKDGIYDVIVDQYSRRETDNVGFTLEVENDGKVTQYSYPKAMTQKGMLVLRFSIKDRKITHLEVMQPDVSGQGIAQQKWGITTESFVKVNTVLNSPNHWAGEHTGNKHWFFILDKCVNDEPTRGIYNEFLKSELETHRKVFEVLGNKTKVLPSNEQLSGLGFSSTQRDSVLVRVLDSTTTKNYKINY